MQLSVRLYMRRGDNDKIVNALFYFYVRRFRRLRVRMYVRASVRLRKMFLSRIVKQNLK